jgi:hypothetical protein
MRTAAMCFLRRLFLDNSSKVLGFVCVAIACPGRGIVFNGEPKRLSSDRIFIKYETKFLSPR